MSPRIMSRQALGKGLGALIKKTEARAAAAAENGGKTPIPWEQTRELIRNWKCGKPTPVYERMGIYR